MVIVSCMMVGVLVKLHKLMRGLVLFLLVIVIVLTGIFFLKFRGEQKLEVKTTEKTRDDEVVELNSVLTPTAIVTLIPTLTSVPTKTVTPTPITKAVSGLPDSGYSTMTVVTEKGNFSVSVLSINLSGVRVVTDTANDADCGDNCLVMSLADFVNRNGGFVGVNGTYFCPDTYADCAMKKNSFDFPVYNSRLSKWINGGNLFWNSRAMVYFRGGKAYYLQNAKDFSGELTAGIVNYPGLVADGVVQIDEAQSGLSDKQRAGGTKVGLGVVGEDNLLIVIARGVNMYEFAYVFKALGAKGALNLDTGGSTAIYYSGKYLAGPGRNIPNAVILVK